jgi:hypothetical protein
MKFEQPTKLPPSSTKRIVGKYRYRTGKEAISLLKTPERIIDANRNAT